MVDDVRLTVRLVGEEDSLNEFPAEGLVVSVPYSRLGDRTLQRVVVGQFQEAGADELVGRRPPLVEAVGQGPEVGVRCGGQRGVDLCERRQERRRRQLWSQGRVHPFEIR
jgi:hypothetical protein